MNICEYLSPTPIKHIVLCGLKKFEKALFHFIFFSKLILKCILRIEKEEEKERERDVILKQSFSRGKTHFAASTRGSSGCSQQF